MNIAVRTRESSERAENAGEVKQNASGANHRVAHTLEPEPILIDPRPCELCGRTIDQHECVDDGDGPEFFCYPDDGLVTQWEVADPRDAWRHTGEAPPIPSRVQERQSDRYRTPQSTIDAFWYVVRLEDADYLKRWLAQHPRDAEALCKLWEGKNATAKA
jgi:hypothetical protein